jgi:hypothetical protein
MGVLVDPAIDSFRQGMDQFSSLTSDRVFDGEGKTSSAAGSKPEK